MVYNESILEHYENPRNVGSLDKNDPSVGSTLKGAPACGDVIKFQIKVEKKKECNNSNIDEDDNYIVTDAKFKTFGCGSAIASSSLLTEKVIGKSFEQIKKITNKSISEELKLPPIKFHCSVLAQEAIEGAIKDYKSKNETIKYNISITENALLKISELLKQNNNSMAYLKFIIKLGGCSGKKYDIKFELKEIQGDLILHNSKNLKILIDKDSKELFRNTQIDHIQNNIESRFVFNNPDIKDFCGCGESFS